MPRKLAVAAIALATIGSGAAATRVWADPGQNPNAEACIGQVMAVLVRNAGSDPMGKVTMTDLIISSVIRPACAAGEPVAAIVQKVREATETQ